MANRQSQRQTPDGDQAGILKDASITTPSGTIRLEDLGRKVCADLGIAPDKIEEVTRAARQALIGKAAKPGGTPAADWPDVLEAIRHEFIRQLGANPKVVSLAEKAGLSFTAFDREASVDNQAEALRSLHKITPATAVSLALLRTRDAADEALSPALSLLGEFEPPLQLVMAVHALRDNRKKWEAPLRGALGETLFAAVEATGALDTQRQFDVGKFLKAALPAVGEAAETRRLLDLGKMYQVARNIPPIKTIELAELPRLMQSVAQIAVNNSELASCVAAALIGRHREELKKVSTRGLVDVLETLDGELAQMFDDYFSPDTKKP